jgi:hypothetical protein
VPRAAGGIDGSHVERGCVERGHDAHFRWRFERDAGAPILQGPLERALLDDVCDTEMAARVPTCAVGAAVFSIDSRDMVAGLESFGMPFDLPVLAPSGTQIVASFRTALETGSLETSLVAAGAHSDRGSSTSYWTGRTATGEFAAADCTGWSGPGGDGAGGLIGATGY